MFEEHIAQKVFAVCGFHYPWEWMLRKREKIF